MAVQWLCHKCGKLIYKNGCDEDLETKFMLCEHCDPEE